MRCSICEYRYYPEAESNYTSCWVFGDEVPEKYERKDGEGCKCNRKQLAKYFQENEEAWMKEAEALVNWYQHQSKESVDKE